MLGLQHKTQKTYAFSIQIIHDPDGTKKNKTLVEA